ncbi:MAG: tRNA (guanosine(46)-N7)-methyltransferase TrmB [Eubacterium sp.]|nr:tRNA (guanosine(46)-N7)-methyltransferase TrmB [Eubacterium sp.]
MRMRHKKHLEARLAQVQEYLITPRNDSLNHKDVLKEQKLFDFRQLFGNDHPVYLEIGGGKGQFACQFAAQHPEANLLMVERVNDVIVTACETAKAMALTNVKFVSCAAEYLPSYIPAHSIEGLFLNFSCPFPKNTYANHRLTSPRFLNSYKSFLKDGAVICQKTDNMHFFEFSLESFSQCGFVLSAISLDLHNSDFEGNIVTEYEAKFAAQGLPIYRLEARLPQQESEKC